MAKLTGIGVPVAVARPVVLVRDVSAWAIPVPHAPDHRIVLTGERYGVALPWPHQVHQVSGVLLLPPTVTPRGPITWIQPPQEDSLRLCREIDLFGALRTALRS